MSKYASKILKALNNEKATIASDGIPGADVAGWVDTGSYALNAAISGSIYRGLPTNKVTGVAGDPSTGKTFIALGLCRKFLDENPEGVVVYFDSEQAVGVENIEAFRGSYGDRFVMSPVDTVEAFRTQAVNILHAHKETPEESRPPMFMVLDSIGGLSTNKELKDALEGNDVKDMTKYQLLKSVFRVVTLMLGELNVPLFVTGHAYDAIGTYGSPKVVGGGKGMQYAASTILMLSKKVLREEDSDEPGILITCRSKKSRFVRDNVSAELCVLYDRGVDRFYGMLDMALAGGIVVKEGKQYVFPSGAKAFGKTIRENPAEYFTKDVLDRIDAYAKRIYGFRSEKVGEEEDAS